MRSHLTLEIFTPQELNQSSYFRTGLFEMEGMGMLECKVILETSTKRGRLSTKDGKATFSDHPFPKASYYRLIDKNNNRSIFFAVDGYDIAYLFSDYALRNCDFIFKRHYNKEYIAPLDESIRSKIYPLGLSFKVQSRYRHGSIFLLLGLVKGNLKLMRPDRTFLKRGQKIFKKNYMQWAKIRSARIWEDFNEYSELNEPFAVFQTRCFKNHDEHDVKSIHDQRAQIIRTLNERLGGRFKGGFIPNETSKKYYPDCLTNMPTDPHGYLQLVKKASIGIYTRGLVQSPAWKLAEYLSQGKCIIAEPLTTELPVPLEHGKHLMYFHSVEECADLCEMLLNNPGKMRELSKNARTYYEENVDPVVNVQRILKLMLESQ